MSAFWEGVYRAWYGLEQAFIECHEWMGAEWPEGNEPDGAIYYDVYTPCEDGTLGVVDGGVLGYDNGAFSNPVEFKKYLSQFMHDAGQIYEMGPMLSDEDEKKFWEAAA